jgi:hypothetical protein
MVMSQVLVEMAMCAFGGGGDSWLISGVRTQNGSVA